MTESADSVEWVGDARARLIERAVELEAWGDYEGHPNLGKRLILEVDSKIQELKINTNLYATRENDEKVVPLTISNHILIYKKVLNQDSLKLIILDVRRFY